MSLAMIIPFLANATDMEAVLEVGRDNSNQSAVSQDKIDSTEKQTDKIINEWKVVSKQVEGLKIYNEQKRIQIQAQLDLMDNLDDQLTQVVVMQRQIPPLAQRMLEGLERFVELDVPFHVEERKQRLDLVRSSLSNPKVTASEQVRQILEAYNIKVNMAEKLTPLSHQLLLMVKRLLQMFWLLEE
jgi:archaellum component FlaC